MRFNLKRMIFRLAEKTYFSPHVVWELSSCWAGICQKTKRGQAFPVRFYAIWSVSVRKKRMSKWHVNPLCASSHSDNMRYVLLSGGAGCSPKALWAVRLPFRNPVRIPYFRRLPYRGVNNGFSRSPVWLFDRIKWLLSSLRLKRTGRKKSWPVRILSFSKGRWFHI